MWGWPAREGCLAQPHQAAAAAAAAAKKLQEFQIFLAKQQQRHQSAQQRSSQEKRCTRFTSNDCVRLSLLWLTCPQPSFTFVTFVRLIYLKANWSGNQSIQFDHHWLTQIPSWKNLQIKSRIWNRICCQKCSLLNGLLNSARKPMKYFGPANFVIHSFAPIQSKLCEFSFWGYQSPKLSAKIKRWYDPGKNLQ